MHFSNYKFRCHAISKLFTDPKTRADKQAGELSVTTKNYLKQLYREIKYSRRQEFSSKYIEKGLSEEQEAITLLSRVRKKFFKKNNERLSNDYLSGEPDLFEGKDIYSCEVGYDTKCSWSLFTMPFPGDKLPDQYEYQNQCYMALTGAKRWITAYCLVNAPANLIMNEKKMVWYRLDCPLETDETYLQKCIEIEKNMIFDVRSFIRNNPGYDFSCSDWQYDIPMEERVIEFESVRDDLLIESIYGKVKRAREFMSALDKPKISLSLQKSLQPETAC